MLIPKLCQNVLQNNLHAQRDAFVYKWWQLIHLFQLNYFEAIAVFFRWPLPSSPRTYQNLVSPCTINTCERDEKKQKISVYRSFITTWIVGLLGYSCIWPLTGACLACVQALVFGFALWPPLPGQQLLKKKHQKIGTWFVYCRGGLWVRFHLTEGKYFKVCVRQKRNKKEYHKYLVYFLYFTLAGRENKTQPWSHGIWNRASCERSRSWCSFLRQPLHLPLQLLAGTR